MLELLRDLDPDLNRVQQNVAIEIARVEGLIPGEAKAPTFITGDYLVTLKDAVVLSAPTAASNVSLPQARLLSGRSIVIKNRAATAQTIRVTGAFVGGVPEPIDGAGFLNLAQGQSATLYSTGVGWETL